MLRVYLFGSVRVHYDEPYREIHLTRTTQALLAYLILQGKRPCPRQVLAGVFWGDNDEASARNCLNTALWRMRLALEDAPAGRESILISTPSGEICINPDCPVWVDTLTFESALKPMLARPASDLLPAEVAGLEQCLDLYQGELLESFYEDWALRERERMRLLYLNAMECLMHCYWERNELERSLETGLRLLRHDPLREDIHRAMMRLYHVTGRRAQALVQYEQCRALIQQELGIAPMPETQALAAKIQAGEPLEHGAPVWAGAKAAQPVTALQKRAAAAATLEEVCARLLQAQQTFNLAQRELNEALELLGKVK
jgi:DNA-binding SARP family transcriptional activator